MPQPPALRPFCSVEGSRRQHAGFLGGKVFYDADGIGGRAAITMGLVLRNTHFLV